MMGDDLYSKEAINECSKHDWSIVCKEATVDEPGSRIVLNKKEELNEFETYLKYKAKFEDGGLIFTGLYSMTTDIFNYEPVKMKTKEEWGLPHTLLLVAKDHKIEIIKTDFWIQISSPEDIEKAEVLLSA